MDVLPSPSPNAAGAAAPPSAGGTSTVGPTASQVQASSVSGGSPAPLSERLQSRRANQGSGFLNASTAPHASDAAAEAGAGHPSSTQLIDLFLAEAKALGDRVPTDAELRRARQFLKLLEDQTREDHLKAIDELLSHAPRELMEKTQALFDAESFVLAAAGGEFERVKRRLEGDWELVNVVDRDGHTALHAAAAGNHVAIVSILLGRGAQVSQPDYEGYTALHWAVENDALEAGQLLLKYNADMNCRTVRDVGISDLLALLTIDRRAKWNELLNAAREDRKKAEAARQALKSSRTSTLSRVQTSTQ